MAGAGYKLFNTGDVLTAAQVNTYLMEQTVMVFANAAARTTALSGVVSEGMISYLKDTNAVEVYDGSNWVSSDDPNAIQNTIVDAKGDLISASAADTPARLAVGNNGETLVADSSTSTGLRWQGHIEAGKNFIINGNMDFYQRGSFSSTSSAYSLDRWKTAVGGSASATTVTQQTTGVPAGSRYCMRIASGASGGYGTPVQAIETNNTVLLQGKTVTVSLRLRRNATYGGNVTLYLKKNATVDADPFGAGWSNITTAQATNAQLPTGTTSADWYLLTLTGTIPNDGTANTIAVEIGGDVASSGAYWEVAQVQLELGSVATTFSRAGGTLAGEFQACQRYYQILHGLTGNADATTQIHAPVNFVVAMRTSPSVAGSAALYISDGTNDFTQSATNVAFVNGNRVSSQNCQLRMQNFTGLTQWRAYMLVSTLGGDIQFSAEL